MELTTCRVSCRWFFAYVALCMMPLALSDQKRTARLHAYLVGMSVATFAPAILACCGDLVVFNWSPNFLRWPHSCIYAYRFVCVMCYVLRVAFVHAYLLEYCAAMDPTFQLYGVRHNLWMPLSKGWRLTNLCVSNSTTLHFPGSCKQSMLASQLSQLCLAFCFAR